MPAPCQGPCFPAARWPTVTAPMAAPGRAPTPGTGKLKAAGRAALLPPQREILPRARRTLGRDAEPPSHPTSQTAAVSRKRAECFPLPFLGEIQRFLSSWLCPGGSVSSLHPLSPHREIQVWSWEGQGAAEPRLSPPHPLPGACSGRGAVADPARRCPSRWLPASRRRVSVWFPLADAPVLMGFAHILQTRLKAAGAG